MKFSFQNEFDRMQSSFSDRLRNVKYSAEYLDLKDDLASAGSKMKHVFQNDLKSAGKNVGKIIKNVVKNDRFRSLIRS